MKITMKTLVLLVFFTILSLILLSSTCKKHRKDDNLCLSKRPYTGNELRTDGYYYLGSDSHFFTTCFFYENGVFLDWGGTPQNVGDPFVFVEEQYTSETSLNRIRKSKSSWGVFEINGSNIKFVRWYCSDGVCRTFVREGVILNDTSFRITKSYHCSGSDITDGRDELYQFKAFPYKPDSTNNFIK